MPANAPNRPMPAGSWPITEQAALALEREIASLERELAEPASAAEDQPPGAGAAALRRAAARRLDTLRTVVAAADVSRDPARAAVGRRVTLLEAAGPPERIWLVAPGDGDPDQGWVAADTPVGLAVLGRRIGERVTVDAPGGAWDAEIVSVD